VSELANLAERLTREALAAENEILTKPKLLAHLGIADAIRKCLAKKMQSKEPRHIRVMRFDFHFTKGGWQISEVNADVPGGYVEASGWNELVAARTEGFSAACSPTRAYADAICELAAQGSLVVLAHATVYSEDRQVMMHLSRELESRGMKACLISPRNLSWSDGKAKLETRFANADPEVVIRLSPAEWLPSMCNGTDWEPWFHGGVTPLSNPGRALILQSKRFPLLWSELKTDLSTWRQLLPWSCCPAEIKNLDQENLVLKPAFGRVGEDVGIHGVTPAEKYREIVRAARKNENLWIAQERFEVAPVATEDGDVFPCIGVYTVNGRMAGLYGRTAHTALIDQDALDVAVLTRQENSGRPQ
jgi:glutathionylspermidine synthase